jgi:hypothetical protein
MAQAIDPMMFMGSGDSPSASVAASRGTLQWLTKTLGIAYT